MRKKLVENEEDLIHVPRSKKDTHNGAEYNARIAIPMYQALAYDKWKDFVVNAPFVDKEERQCSVGHQKLRALCALSEEERQCKNSEVEREEFERIPSLVAPMLARRSASSSSSILIQIRQHLLLSHCPAIDSEVPPPNVDTSHCAEWHSKTQIS